MANKTLPIDSGNIGDLDSLPIQENQLHIATDDISNRFKWFFDKTGIRYKLSLDDDGFPLLSSNPDRVYDSTTQDSFRSQIDVYSKTETISSDQGATNSGKALVVGSDGLITLKDIDLSTSDVRIETFVETDDITSLVLQNECPNESYITINIDNTTILSDNYHLEDDKKTITFINPLAVKVGGSVVEVTYFMKIGTFTDVYTKDETDRLVGEPSLALKLILDGVIE